MGRVGIVVTCRCILLECKSGADGESVSWRPLLELLELIVGSVSFSALALSHEVNVVEIPGERDLITGIDTGQVSDLETLSHEVRPDGVSDLSFVHHGSKYSPRPLLLGQSSVH